MNTIPNPYGTQKPGKVQTIAIMTLVSGISNIIWMLFVGFSLLLGALASLGITCLFMPIVIPPLVLGVFEIVYAAKLLPNPAKPVQPSQALAIMEIICLLTGNVISVAAGIVALVMYNDPEVREYFARINGQA